MGERNKGKPPICRIASLNHFDGVLIGRDLGAIFEEGHLYQARKIGSEIIITDIGEHAEPLYLEGGKGSVSQYITSGVVFLNKKEYEAEKAAKGE